MTRISREKFKSDFSRDDFEIAIDVRKLDGDTRKRLEIAGIKTKDLFEVARGDGKISGEEYYALFEKVEALEGDDSHDSFETLESIRWGDRLSPSGRAYEALKNEFERNHARARVKDVTKDSPSVPKGDSYRKHIEQVRAELKKEMRNVKNVTIFVIGENETKHAAAVLRTITGKVGLAQGADVRLQENHKFKEK